MAFTGLGNNVNLDNSLMPDVNRVVAMLTADDTPLQSGSVEGRTVLAVRQAKRERIDWFEDTLLTGVSAVVGTLVTAGTELTVTAGTRPHFSTGDALIIGAEIVRVAGYSTGADILNITRAVSGTAAQYTAGTLVRSLGRMQADGADATDARMVDRTNQFNYTQVFVDELALTGTRQNVQDWITGMGGERDYQEYKKLAEHMIKRERAIIKGRRVLDGSNRRLMGGLDEFAGIVDTTAGALTETMLKNMVRTIYENGADIGDLVILASPRQRDVISSFTTFGVIQVQRGDGTRGTSVNKFVSDFGQGTVVTHRHLASSELYVYSRENVAIAPLRSVEIQPLAKTGDADRAQILSEISLEVTKGVQVGRFTSLT